MTKQDSFYFDGSTLLMNFTTIALTFGLTLGTGLLVSAQARSMAPLDASWTQSLHEEVKVMAERFTGHSGERPDWIAAHCGRASTDIGTTSCPKR